MDVVAKIADSKRYLVRTVAGGPKDARGLVVDLEYKTISDERPLQCYICRGYWGDLTPDDDPEAILAEVKGAMEAIGEAEETDDSRSHGWKRM